MDEYIECPDCGEYDIDGQVPDPPMSRTEYFGPAHPVRPEAPSPQPVATFNTGLEDIPSWQFTLLAVMIAIFVIGFCIKVV